MTKNAPDYATTANLKTLPESGAIFYRFFSLIKENMPIARIASEAMIVI